MAYLLAIDRLCYDFHINGSIIVPELYTPDATSNHSILSARIYRLLWSKAAAAGFYSA